jgi:5-methylcytosine-specific restriction protein B
MEAGAWEIDVHAIPVEGEALAKNWEELKIEELMPYAAHLSGPRWKHIFSQRDKSKKVGDAVPPFFIIIDEINRAELSRVLGELMLCLEYRGIEGAVSTQYAALNTADTGMIKVGGGFKFFIPNNVYVIGTMNTIDRSVESFDLALRRRFRWERIEPDIEALRYQLKERDAQQGDKSQPWSGLADDLEALNERIRKNELLGEDYQIGHAYLMNLRYPADLNRSQVRKKVWDDNIKPLLEEYLRGSGRSDTLIPEFSKAFGVT